MKELLPIIIPALEPDDRLTLLLEQLQKNSIGPVIIVDDGSGEKYKEIFDAAEKNYGCILLRHALNLGKGRALKDAFNYCLNHYPDMIGCVTADSDGQHSPMCIKKCQDELEKNPFNLILGVRNFDEENVPTKSRYGNKITRNICRFLCGISVSDTQTGLRAIPKEFMKKLLSVKGERFDFETRMLIAAKDNDVTIKEVPIKTVYDSRENHSTHFNPIRDSLKIMKIFGGVFIRFVFSSLSSSVVDLLLFTAFCNMLKGHIEGAFYVTAATVIARIVSSVYNFLINYKVVFKSKANKKMAALRYFLLASIQMLCSAALVTGFMVLLPSSPELAVKIPVDVVLFFLSYFVQREFVYH